MAVTPRRALTWLDDATIARPDAITSSDAKDGRLPNHGQIEALNGPLPRRPLEENQASVHRRERRDEYRFAQNPDAGICGSSVGGPPPGQPSCKVPARGG